jgi:hypothetical protein
MRWAHARILRSCLAMLAFVVWTVAAHASAIVELLDIPGSTPCRILDGSQVGEYWIVDPGDGLRLLSEDQQGNWSCSDLYGDHLYDAAGPDYRNRIYCTFYSLSSGSGVYVFDCEQRAIVDSVVLGADYPLSGLALSADGDSLFVLGCDWPRVGVVGGSWIDSGAHPDSGILWQIDLDSLSVVEQQSTSALPETIYYAETSSGPDKLLVSTQSIFGHAGDVVLLTDVFEVVEGLPKETRILSPFCLGPFSPDTFDWSDEDYLVAMCSNIHPKIEEEQYRAGIWLIDPDLSQVVNYITITDGDGRQFGAHHACASAVNPCVIFISTDYESPYDLYAVDRDTGEIIAPVGTLSGFKSEFLYETPDGLLIVTGGTCGKILIIDHGF